MNHMHARAEPKPETQRHAVVMRIFPRVFALSSQWCIFFNFYIIIFF